MAKPLMNQYGDKILQNFKERAKNLEILMLVGDNFNTAWGGVKAKT